MQDGRLSAGMLLRAGDDGESDFVLFLQWGICSKAGLGLAIQKISCNGTRITEQIVPNHTPGQPRPR